MHADTLSLQLDYAQGLLAASLEDLSQEESLRSPAGGGNCINWLAGHLLISRNGALKLLGRETVQEDALGEAYRRGSTGLADSGDALELSALREALADSHASLKAGLAGMDPARLDEAFPSSPFKNPNETLGSLLAGLVFHECYHVGQVGILRRGLGKPGLIR